MEWYYSIYGGRVGGALQLDTSHSPLKGALKKATCGPQYRPQVVLGAGGTAHGLGDDISPQGLAATQAAVLRPYVDARVTTTEQELNSRRHRPRSFPAPGLS